MGEPVLRVKGERDREITLGETRICTSQKQAQQWREDGHFLLQCLDVNWTAIAGKDPSFTPTTKSK